jgi:hypothetical protein
VRHPSGWVGPAFEVRDLLVWGFTAGLLDKLLALGGWERPWDTGRSRTLDPETDRARDARRHLPRRDLPAGLTPRNPMKRQLVPARPRRPAHRLRRRRAAATAAARPP